MTYEYTCVRYFNSGLKRIWNVACTRNAQPLCLCALCTYNNIVNNNNRNNNNIIIIIIEYDFGLTKRPYER